LSENPNNNGPNPDNLRRAFGMMRREVRRIEQTTRRNRKAGLMFGPRQFCAVCGKTFDNATVDPNAILTKSICSACKQMLAAGYTACIVSEEYAFIMSDFLKQQGLAGKIVPMSEPAFKKIREKFDQKKAKTNGVPKENPPG
jgi:hypothetical protein